MIRDTNVHKLDGFIIDVIAFERLHPVSTHDINPSGCEQCIECGADLAHADNQISHGNGRSRFG